MKKKVIKNIGIITWHYYYNFGSALQAYALQRVLNQYADNVAILNYRKKNLYSDRIKDTLRYILGRVTEAFYKDGKHKHVYAFARFQKEYFHQSKYMFSEIELHDKAKSLDYVVCGSDQIWAPNVFFPVYMANFAAGTDSKVISYAASIGLNEIPIEMRPMYENLLSHFTAVSVREEQGHKALKQDCNIDAKVVLDPTLLLKADDYRRIEKRVSDIPKQYIFCYFLNANNTYRETVESFAEENGLKIVGVSLDARDGEWIDQRRYIGPLEFLWMIDHAEAVFTDSYHGTIFSLLFHTNLYLFQRFAKDDPICQNSRIEQLDYYFDVRKRMVVGKEDVKSCGVLDIIEFERKLQQERENSFKFLREALGECFIS